MMAGALHHVAFYRETQTARQWLIGACNRFSGLRAGAAKSTASPRRACGRDPSEMTPSGHSSVQQLQEDSAMKGINHLVLASLDLEALRSAYQALGFAVKARGGLPFGISNSVVQLQGSYLELLSVTGDVPEHSPGHFSFGAFNRDYLARHEGFSMLVLDTPDARADIS